MFLVSFFVIFLRLSCAVSNVVNKEKWLECLCLTFQPLRISSSISVRDDYALQYSIFFLHNPESQYVGFGCPGIWGEHTAIAFKAICTLKSNAIRYVNSLFLHCCKLLMSHKIGCKVTTLHLFHQILNKLIFSPFSFIYFVYNIFN